MSENLRVLVLGDIVGQPGCRALFVGLPDLARRFHADLVIANGENAADGFGLTPEIAERMFKSGVHVITSGNHIWQKHEIYPMLKTSDTLLRPENYPVISGPDAIPGKGHCIVTARDIPVLVVNLEGRVNLSPLRDPIQVGKSILKQYRGRARVSIVDFHAEAVEEKEALGLSFDGEATAVIGTHTHVQTADERILPGGTAYITDIGMTGPTDSVIGMRRETALSRSLTQMPLKMEVQNSAAEIWGVFIECDPSSGKAVRIERIRQLSAV
ncbi:MAG TPA: TIGR00282 family metallophosphoesterase [Spirochaetia bacterium]|nr:TIGR00282 family metallophosphoesterase [Spirochaetia bacterium]